MSGSAKIAASLRPRESSARAQAAAASCLIAFSRSSSPVLDPRLGKIRGTDKAVVATTNYDCIKPLMPAPSFAPKSARIPMVQAD
jgi:hypothetical protein